MLAEKTVIREVGESQPCILRDISVTGMLRHSLGVAVIMFSLQHFIAPSVDLMPYLPSQQRREAIKALNLV